MSYKEIADLMKETEQKLIAKFLKDLKNMTNWTSVIYTESVSDVWDVIKILIEKWEGKIL